MCGICMFCAICSPLGILDGAWKCVLYSHLTSPLPGSMLWLWAALPSVFLMSVHGHSGDIGRVVTTEPLPAHPELCAKSPWTPVGASRVSACRNSL